MTKRELTALRKQPLGTIADKRAELERELEAVYGILLDRALEEAEQEGANVTAVARRAGIARATVYNELARRQQQRDTLEERGPVPAAAAGP